MAQVVDGRIKYIRVKYEDGSVSDAIPIMVLPDNVDFEDGEKLVEKLDKLAQRSIYQDNAISIGRADTENIGDGSVAVGEGLTASGVGSQAYGKNCQATGDYAHAEGVDNNASGDNSHAEGVKNSAIGSGAHVEGVQNQAYGGSSFTGGTFNINSGISTLVYGNSNEALAGADNSLIIGHGNVGYSPNSFIHGEYNDYDTDKEYAEIIGAGTQQKRKNIYTLDWEGNLTIAGKLKARQLVGEVELDQHGNDFSSYIKDVKLKSNVLTATRGNGESEILKFDGFSEQGLTSFNSMNTTDYTILSGEKKVVLQFDTNLDGVSYLNNTNCLGTGNLHFLCNQGSNDRGIVYVRFLCVDKGTVITDSTWEKAYSVQSACYAGDNNISLYFPTMRVNTIKGSTIYIRVDYSGITGGKLYVSKKDASMTVIGMKSKDDGGTPAPTGGMDRIVNRLSPRLMQGNKARVKNASCHVLEIIDNSLEIEGGNL